MKNKIFIVISCMAIAILALASQALAVDWSQYESGRDNIRLDGYQSQPGYIAFTGGDGVTRTILYSNQNGELMYVPLVANGAASSGAFDLKNTKLTDGIGFMLDRLD